MMKNKKRFYIALGILAFAGAVAEGWHWLNQVPEVRQALISEEDKPIPVTNDWRLALLDSVNLPVSDGIKASLQNHVKRFERNRITGEITAVSDITARFNWPLDLLKEPKNDSENPPSSAHAVHIKRLPEKLPFWRVNDDDTIIIPIVAQGKYGLAAGFLAINEKDKSIIGVRFYHSEDSPGLGQEVIRPDFGQRFVGKKLVDANGHFSLKMIIPKNTYQAQANEVDGIAGATMMSDGIEDALKFWLGEDAYGLLRI